MNPKTGEIRYGIDIDKAIRYGGLEITRSRSGRVVNAEYHGNCIGPTLASRMVNSIATVYAVNYGSGRYNVVVTDAVGYDNDYPVFKRYIERGLREVLGIVI